MVLGLVLFAATILALRRRGVGVLERYRYTIAAVGIGMTVLPRAARDRRAGQRRLPRHPRRRRLLPAGRAREGRDRDLPRQLPARQPPDPRDRRAARAGVDDPADEAVRPDADRVGGGDGDAAAHARARHLADVLRRVPRAAVRGHRAPLVPADRRSCCSPLGAWFLAGHVSHVARARARVGTPLRRRLCTTASKVAATSSRSRCSRRPTGACSAPASTSRCCARADHGPPILPVPESDMIYAVIVNELGLVGRRGAAAASTCCSWRAG